VITGCGDGVVRCFDAKSGNLLRTYSGAPGAILQLVCANDSIYSATTDGTCRIYKIEWEFIK
jgi:WD40 repeat protein